MYAFCIDVMYGYMYVCMLVCILAMLCMCVSISNVYVCNYVRVRVRIARVVWGCVLCVRMHVKFLPVFLILTTSELQGSCFHACVTKLYKLSSGASTDFRCNSGLANLFTLLRLSQGLWRARPKSGGGGVCRKTAHNDWGARAYFTSQEAVLVD